MCDFALPDDFTDEQKKALLAASEFVFDIYWADVTNYKQLGLTVAENLELPDWAFTYFDFEKYRVKNSTLNSSTRNFLFCDFIS